MVADRVQVPPVFIGGARRGKGRSWEEKEEDGERGWEEVAWKNMQQAYAGPWSDGCVALSYVRRATAAGRQRRDAPR